MDRADWERAAAIYLPLVAAIIARSLNGRRPKQFAACLLSLLWTAPSLIVLQRWNEYAGWWSFAPSPGPALRGMPLELFIGWVIFWGLFPQVALPRFGIFWSAVVMVAVDCILMPTSTSAIYLKSNWLVGEAAGVVVVLVPALYIAQWTREDTNLRGRVALQIATSGLLFLFLVPEIIFALRPGVGWAPMLGLPSWVRQIGLQIVLLLALPGIAAVMEFAERGFGTPIPYDPPQRLVTSGIYRYCANPMQLSCGLVMLAWAGLLGNGWMLIAALVSVVYSAGIAEWDEGEDLARRFGDEWGRYRSEVGNWWPRWRPYHTGPPALLYIARSCGPCSEVRAWLEARTPVGLQIVDAETLQAKSIRRMRYDPGDGSETVEGVRAMGRALEHLHLGWAMCGATLRLPVFWRFLQLLMDASGLGPREITIEPELCALRGAQSPNSAVAPLFPQTQTYTDRTSLLPTSTPAPKG
jgi:protein-S-isoprenylcysteine O-methyltransferase Ste14